LHNIFTIAKVLEIEITLPFSHLIVETNKPLQACRILHPVLVRSIRILYFRVGHRSAERQAPRIIKPFCILQLNPGIAELSRIHCIVFFCHWIITPADFILHIHVVDGSLPSITAATNLNPRLIGPAALRL